MVKVYTFNSREELVKFIASEIIDTSEAIKILDCNKGNIDDFIKKGKLVPICSLSKTRIFFKEDVEALKCRKSKPIFKGIL